MARSPANGPAECSTALRTPTDLFERTTEPVACLLQRGIGGAGKMGLAERLHQVGKCRTRVLMDEWTTVIERGPASSIGKRAARRINHAEHGDSLRRVLRRFTEKLHFQKRSR